MNRGMRIALAVVLVLVVLWLLFTIVFPWVEQRMEDPTLGTVSTVARIG
ncbi:MAG: hypothetical protein KY437_06650 [Actinobacteria bacterium]|nr:hypothetical protein [Actinomycetota bacterium]